MFKSVVVWGQWRNVNCKKDCVPFCFICSYPKILTCWTALILKTDTAYARKQDSDSVSDLQESSHHLFDKGGCDLIIKPSSQRWIKVIYCVFDKSMISVHLPTQKTLIKVASDSKWKLLLSKKTGET